MPGNNVLHFLQVRSHQLKRSLACTSRVFHLLTLDKYAKIEMTYFEASSGQPGMERVQNLIKALFPSSKQHHKTTVEVLKAFDKHSGDKLLCFAGVGATTIFTNVKSFVESIAEGAMPSFQGATETRFFKSVKDQLLLFAQVDVPWSSGIAKMVLLGKDAVKHQFLKVSEMTTAPTHPDFTMQIVFGWALSKT